MVERARIVWSARMGAFDFLQNSARYAESPLSLNRLNVRHEFIVEAFPR